MGPAQACPLARIALQVCTRPPPLQTLLRRVSRALQVPTVVSLACLLAQAVPLACILRLPPRLFVLVVLLDFIPPPLVLHLRQRVSPAALVLLVLSLVHLLAQAVQRASFLRPPLRLFALVVCLGHTALALPLALVMRVVLDCTPLHPRLSRQPPVFLVQRVVIVRFLPPRAVLCVLWALILLLLGRWSPPPV